MAQSSSGDKSVDSLNKIRRDLSAEIAARAYTFYTLGVMFREKADSSNPSKSPATDDTRSESSPCPYG